MEKFKVKSLEFRVKSLSLVARHLSLVACRLSLITLFALLFSSCHVHEWPKGGMEAFKLNLDFSTAFERIDYPYGESKADGRSRYYSIELTEGVISYTVKAFPLVDGNVDRNIYLEFNFMRDIKQGFNASFDLNLDPGEYTVMVFAQLAKSAEGPFYYDDSNFWSIKLQGEYEGDTNYRDAFRGLSSIVVGESNTATMQMTRPLAKYEFISTDLAEFFTKEEARVKSKGLETRNSLEDYDVVFYYIGYTPTAYNLPEDRNVDSKTGLTFTSVPEVLTEDEVSLGFDYVFCSTTETHVTLQIALYDRESGERVSLSQQIRIPLMRSFDTIVTGSFLFENADSGIGVNPDFAGEYNQFFDI